jgi:hypothetical protein
MNPAQEKYTVRVAEAFERVRFFVPGTPASLDAWKVEWVENDGTFGQAFSFGTVVADVVEAIDAAPSALVRYSSVDLRQGRRQNVVAVERLRDAGALALVGACRPRISC